MDKPSATQNSTIAPGNTKQFIIDGKCMFRCNSLACYLQFLQNFIYMICQLLLFQITIGIHTITIAPLLESTVPATDKQSATRDSYIEPVKAQQLSMDGKPPLGLSTGDFRLDAVALVAEIERQSVSVRASVTKPNTGTVGESAKSSGMWMRCCMVYISCIHTSPYISVTGQRTDTSVRHPVVRKRRVRFQSSDKTSVSKSRCTSYQYRHTVCTYESRFAYLHTFIPT